MYIKIAATREEIEFYKKDLTEFRPNLNPDLIRLAWLNR